MTGFSIRKDKWLTFLLIGGIMLLILPILAGAQTGDDETPQLTDEATEGITGEDEAAAADDGITDDAAEPAPAEAPEPEMVAKYHYFVLHSNDPDAPIEEWDVVARFAADTRSMGHSGRYGYTYQQPGYFGFGSFFGDDPNPEKPTPPEYLKPTEPVKPDQADFVDKDREFKEEMDYYETEFVKYEKTLEKYQEYEADTYPGLLEKYNEESAEFDKDEYSGLKHYAFFTRNIPNSKPKKSIYKLTILQPEVELPAEEPEPVPMDVIPADETAEPGEDIEPDTEAEGVVPVDEPSTTDEPVSITPPVPEEPEAPKPAEPPPGDLVLPKELWIADRPSDEGGTISLHWEATGSDLITVEKPFEPAADLPVEEEEKEKIIPEYELDKFIVNAWVYDPDIDLTNQAEIDAIDLVVDVSTLGGDKEFKLDFVDIFNNPGKPDDGLGLHFQGTFTNQKTEIEILGKHTVTAKATAPGMPTRRGKVKVNKIAGQPVDASNEEDSIPDNRYTHYFKLGVDLWDHEGPPRWFVPQDPPKGLIAKANIVNWRRWNILLYTILYTIAILGFISIARKGRKLFVRRIAGLDHVEEAIGRATEMGKPILFIPGIGSMADVATIAAVNILGQVARKVAEYDSRIIVPNKDPIVMTVAQEVTQEAYIDAGHPDRFKKDDVFFVTDDQFAFTAAVDGIMVREKPATILLMGMFYAESLILAETGAGTGAIQIAGTDATHQLPFFITACDYTLIGEELYAASAYLAREPLLLGSLKGQDLAKAFIWVAIVVGVILSSIGIEFFSKFFMSL